MTRRALTPIAAIIPAVLEALRRLAASQELH